MGGDEIAALGHCSVNGSLHSLEHKTLALLKDAGKTAQGWSELLLVTDGTEGYENTVINAWKGGSPSKHTGVPDVTARGYRAVNSNQTAYYFGWNAIAYKDMYIDIGSGVPSSQRSLLLGGEVAVCARRLFPDLVALASRHSQMHRHWRLGTDHYTAPKLGLQCGVDAGPQPNPAKALFPRTEDDAFALSTLVSPTELHRCPLPRALAPAVARRV